MYGIRLVFEGDADLVARSSELERTPGSRGGPEPGQAE